VRGAFMKNDKILIIVSILLIFTLYSLQAQNLKIGVVEFDEKNNIGIENAGKIVPEWIVTEIKKIGLYDVEERLFLKQVLEEQKLMLSGVIDESQVVEIGKLYGIDAIITGSVMKIGSKISVTGRIINVETAEVLKTASVTTDSLNSLEFEVTILANELSEISREQFVVREAIKEKSVQRLELGSGLGVGWNNSEETDSSSFHLEALLKYNSRYFTMWFDASPVGTIQNIELGGAVYVTHYLGVGSSIGRIFDNAFDYVTLTYLHFGIVAQPVKNLEMGIFLGGALDSAVHTDEEEIETGSYWGFGSNYNAWVTYSINDDFSMMVRVLGAEHGGIEDKISEIGYFPNSDNEYISGKLSLIFIYVLGI
jgi:TolB-like protein